MLSDTHYFPAHEENPMFPHLIFLSFQALNWDDYVEHLREVLEPLVRNPSCKVYDFVS